MISLLRSACSSSFFLHWNFACPTINDDRTISISQCISFEAILNIRMLLFVVVVVVAVFDVCGIVCICLNLITICIFSEWLMLCVHTVYLFQHILESSMYAFCFLFVIQPHFRSLYTNANDARAIIFQNVHISIFVWIWIDSMDFFFLLRCLKHVSYPYTHTVIRTEYGIETSHAVSNRHSCLQCVVYGFFFVILLFHRYIVL